jgi:molybdate transport system substrate-binding protein
MRPLFTELQPLFERATGHTLKIKFAFVPAAMQEIEAGGKFDLVILEPYGVDDLISRERVAIGTRKNVGYVGIGVGTRAGSRKPDIGSIDSFRRALLGAQSISYQPDTGSGRYFAGLLQRLGIAAIVEPRLKPKPGGAAVSSVATGEAELVVISIPAILATPGVELVGPLPSEIQSYIRFEAAVTSTTNVASAAAALLEFMTSASVAQVFGRVGMAQGAP